MTIFPIQRCGVTEWILGGKKKTHKTERPEAKLTLLLNILQM